jgi:hypothetical protein
MLHSVKHCSIDSEQNRLSGLVRFFVLETSRVAKLGRSIWTRLYIFTKLIRLFAVSRLAAVNK